MVCLLQDFFVFARKIEMIRVSKGLPLANCLNCLQASEPSCTKHCKNC